MKILIVVLSYLDNGIYTKFFQTQNESWNSIQVEGVETFFLTGSHDRDEVDGNLIKTNVKESIFNCGFKTIKAFELLKNFEYDYIFRTNSSSYVDKQMLFDYLYDKPRNNYYCGIIGNYRNILYASGSGFAISKNAVDLVLQNKNSWDHGYIDDVSLGLLLKKFDISPTLAPRFDVQTVDDKTPMDYYHYRIKTSNRERDCQYMKSIYELKKLSYK